jgi:flagellar protein FliO/FliZ
MTGIAPAASPLSVSSLAQMTLSLLAIVALILAISWVLKRTRLAGSRGRGQISVVDEITLGPRERVVLLRVGDSQVLVGIAAAGIVGLTPLDTPIVLQQPAAPAGAPAFAERLREFMRRPGGSA